MSRIIRMLVAVTAAGGLSLAGLLTAGAASAVTNPGTTGPGTWSFGTFDSAGNYHEGITSTTSPPTVSYTATVQQPINAPGQIPSVFSNKTRTIPVKYTVNKCTTPGASSAHYPGLLDSSSYAGDPVTATNLNWTPPGSLTVGQITNLTANFTWQTGQNHTGSMYWIVNTPDGNVWIYYGDITGTGVYTGTSGSGANMISIGGARAEASQLGHSPQYDTLANILAAAPASGSVPSIGQEPVNWIGLAVDEGNQAVQLSTANPAVDITTSAFGDTTYTPGDESSGGGSQTCAPDNTDNFWISLTKISGSAPAAPVDESTITDTQGDTGGQFRQVDSMYMYNLPMSQLDPTAQYQVGISPNSDGSSPVGVVQFGLK